MRDVLIVLGGDQVARREFRDDGLVDWAQALPLVLEKLGVVRVDVADSRSAIDAETLADYAVVLVARSGCEWLDPGDLVRDGVRAIVEGPLPELLLARLGVESAGPLGLPGRVLVGDSAIRAAAARYGIGVGGVIEEVKRVPLPSSPSVQWPDTPAPISPARARAWRKRSWTVDRWRARAGVDAKQHGVDSLADWVADDGERTSAVVRAGGLVGFSFGVFGFLGQQHTVEPYEADEWRSAPHSAGIEGLLMALIDAQYSRADVTRLRLLPWPHPARWACTVRHAIDQPAVPSELRSLAGDHRRVRTRATWYFAPSAVNRPAQDLCSLELDEIGVLAEHVWSSPSEDMRAIRRSLRVSPRGAATHGSARRFRWQGAPNVLWAASQGLGHIELHGRAPMHPHRFANVAEDGTVSPLGDFICLPPPERLDLLARAPQSLREVLTLWDAAGGALQLSLPADRRSRIGLDVLGGELGGQLAWTASEVAEWWRRTHLSGRVSVERRGPHEFRVRSSERVEGLQVELLGPDGTHAIHPVTVDVKPTTVIAGPPRHGRLRNWDDARAAWEEAISWYAAAKGMRVDSPEMRTSIANNTDAVPARAEHILRLLGDMSSRRDLAGQVVLDAGCGFAGVSAYVAWRTSPRVVLGIDSDPTTVTAAHRALAEVGMSDQVHVVKAAFTDIHDLPDESVDVVIANGVLMFAHTAGELRAAIRELSRVLRPGGDLLIHHHNRWVWRDPLTGQAMWHLLPNPIARLHWQAAGYRAVRKRWISPFEMRRALRRVRLDERGFIGFTDTGRHTAGLTRYRARTYALAARKPGREAVADPRSPVPSGL